MCKTIRDVIFFCICTSLIFNNIPLSIQMPFLGASVGYKLVFYPLLVGICYTLYCQWKYKGILKKYNYFRNFMLIYLGITFSSVLLGLVKYPYYELIMQGPVCQIEKLPRVLAFLQGHGIDITHQQLLSLWMLTRPVKGLLFETFYTFGGAYMIYCWYSHDWQKAYKILISAVLSTVVIIFIYSFVELLYLANNNSAKCLLEIINPWLHEIETDGKWWPPLLWNGQLRSIFAEPSYFGIYTAFAVPFLWYKLYKQDNIAWGLFFTMLVFLLFLTNARTGFMLFLGELNLLLIAILLFMRQKVYTKKLFVIMLCSVVAFIGSNFFIYSYMNKRTLTDNLDTSTVDLQKSMTAYIDSNAASLANPDKRSNRARYTIMEADFRLGIDHPILGVGHGLRNGYIPEYLSEEGKRNGEVKMWLTFRKNLGILKSGFPPLGEYTVRFGETGILGLFTFLAPALFLIYKMVLKLKENVFQYELEYVMYLISLLGIMAAGIGDTLNITYCYWVLLGLGYAMCFGKDGEEKDVNERA